MDLALIITLILTIGFIVEYKHLKKNSIRYDENKYAILTAIGIITILIIICLL